MLTIVTITALTGLAVTLNTYAARLVDRDGTRRAAQEAHWARMILASRAGR